MKLLITTRADDNIREMTNLTHPIIKKFCKEWNADFIILNEPSGCSHGDGKYHYRILKHYELFNSYDRILHLDSDMILMPDCPNMFDIVDKDCIGTIYEDKGSRQHARRQLIQSSQNTYGHVGWSTGYINTGVFMTSKIHKDIFKKIENGYWVGFGYDDVHLGWNIHKLNYKIQELPFIFNHMSMFSEPLNGYANRFDSYIMHYAGGFDFPDKNNRNKVSIMKDDIISVYGRLIE